jgi:hypothetical protein
MRWAEGLDIVIRINGMCGPVGRTPGSQSTQGS